MTTLADFLDVARDAQLARNYPALQTLRTALRAEYPHVVLLTALVPLAPLACPFVSRSLSSPFALVPLHRALPRALGPSNFAAHQWAVADIDALIASL